MSIKENISNIMNDISQVTEKNGYSNGNVTLIAVTKTRSIDEVNEAIRDGATDIGENKVQEIEAKYDNIQGDVRLHMIGHLQTNKVKCIIDKVDLIHSLDRLSLAKEIQKRAEQNDLVSEVLIQVNVAEEESKFGLKLEQAIPFIESLADYKNIRVKGLMTIAPHQDNIDDVRPIFKSLKQLFEEIKEKNYEHVDMEYLSMGMTNDYKIALEEGANIIRVGTGIFGERVYK